MFAKKAIVQRFASVRFDRVLGSTERDDVARAVGSSGTTVTSWNACGSRTYATLALGGEATTTVLATLLDARVDSPSLAILRIVPDRARALAPLARALGGPGRPAGVRDCAAVDGALVIECDARVTALATLVTLVDCELARAPGRSIEPLVALDDDTLAAFAAAILGEPALDSERLIEPHLARALESVGS